MNREIEFRCWNDHSKIMHDWAELVSKNKIHLLAKNDRPYIVEQYTGLKDCEGKEIYEGDIVIIEEVNEDSSSGSTFEREPVAIVWKNLQWMFDNGKKKVLGERDWTDYANLSSTYGHNVDFKIIGNIHENPSLLGGEK